jgi:hypothetical protein
MPLWVRSGHSTAKSDVRFTPNSDRKSGHPVVDGEEKGTMGRSARHKNFVTTNEA